jgi:hypothetical protein
VQHRAAICVQMTAMIFVLVFPSLYLRVVVAFVFCIRLSLTFVPSQTYLYPALTATTVPTTTLMIHS